MSRLCKFAVGALAVALTTSLAQRPVLGQSSNSRQGGRSWSEAELFGQNADRAQPHVFNGKSRNASSSRSAVRMLSAERETWRSPSRQMESYYEESKPITRQLPDETEIVAIETEASARQRRLTAMKRVEELRSQEEELIARARLRAERDEMAAEDEIPPSPSVYRAGPPLAVGGAAPEVEPVSYMANQDESFADTSDHTAATATAEYAGGAGGSCGGGSNSCSPSSCGSGCGSAYDCALGGCCRQSYSLGRHWVMGEYLMWWMKGSNVPALLTTSDNGTPVGQAGVLGNNATSTLYPNSNFDDQERHGGRLRAGMWLDPCRRIGIQGDYFQLGNLSNNFALNSNGNPILARPFYDVVDDQQDRELLAYPGLVNGGIHSFSNSYLNGAGVNMMLNLTPCCQNGCSQDACGCCQPQICCPCKQISPLGGYRFLNLSENIQINQRAVIENPAALGIPVAAGTSIDSQDRFSTRNEFHGGNMGLQSWFYHGRWSLGLMGSVALGTSFQQVQVLGNSVVTVPGLDPVVNQGGLLALPSNIGTYQRNVFSVVPEANFTVGYALNCHLRATVGYSFLYWTNTLRAAEQIDPNINPTQFPYIANPQGPNAPRVRFNESDIWLQGINLGLTYTW